MKAQRADGLVDDLSADDGAGFEYCSRSLGLTGVGTLSVDDDIGISEGSCGHTDLRVVFSPL